MVERTARVHLIDEPAGTRATRTGCGARLSVGPLTTLASTSGRVFATALGSTLVSTHRELVTCSNCARLPKTWRGLEGYNYRPRARAEETA